MHLAAISPATKAVALGRAAVVVSGLSFRKLTRLIEAYPELVAFVAGGKIEIAALLREGPEASLAAFSLGVVGRPRQPWWRRPMVLLSDGDDSAALVAAFEAAPAGQQVEILGAIFDLTVKGGERAIPFLTRMSGANEPAPPSAPPAEPEVPTETSAASTPASSSA